MRITNKVSEGQVRIKPLTLFRKDKIGNTLHKSN